ncbi:MAG: hypothetical protein L0229_23825 [Blastocatellia bacterium]|nr:hypothetical protein [Blastocatellia bacterium]
MIYRMPGNALSEIHINTLVTFPVSLTFSQTVEIASIDLQYRPDERAIVTEEITTTHHANLIPFAPHVRAQASGLPRPSEVISKGRKTAAYDNGREIPKLKIAPDERWMATSHYFSLQGSPLKAVEVRKSRGAWQGGSDLPGIIALETPALPLTHYSITNEASEYRNDSISPFVFEHRAGREEAVNAFDAMTSRPFLFSPQASILIEKGEPVCDRRYDRAVPPVSVHPSNEFKPVLEKPFEFETLVKESLIPVLNQQFVASAVHAIGDAREHRPESIEHELTFLREEESLRPPQLGYVFTRPANHIAEERQVIKRVEQKEVVEMVRKEVQTAMSSGSVAMNLTRTDYGRIADHVYSALARRLVAERERLGLRA